MSNGRRRRRNNRRRPQPPKKKSPPALPSASTPPRSDPVPLALGVLQIAVPIIFAVAALHLTGRTGLRYLGATLLVVAAVCLIIWFTSRKTRWNWRWTLLSCAAVGTLALGTSFVPARYVPGLPTPVDAGPPTADGPYFSYLDKATATDQDTDVGFRYGGWIRQTFTAGGTQIASVAVIVSRDADAMPGYDPHAIGHVLLKLWRVDGSNRTTTELPLNPADGRREETSEDDGIRAMAGPNHSDTVIRFDPVTVTPGERLAFEVSNDEPGVRLAFSLRPTGNPAGPVFWDGSSNPTQAIAGRTNRAVAGYVCDVSSGC